LNRWADNKPTQQSALFRAVKSLNKRSRPIL
jgi:hypothetical protein